jgi:hypothetical protein
MVSIKIEQTDHLDSEDMALLTSIVGMVGAAAETGRTLRDVEKALRWALRGIWYIYRGGNHVALHRKSGDARRIAIITED